MSSTAPSSLRNSSASARWMRSVSERASVYIFGALLLSGIVNTAPALAQKGKTKVLVLPTFGATTGIPRGQIRRAIRGTLIDEMRTFDVLSTKASRALLAQAKSLDVVCKADDGDCLLKLGILADVGLVIASQVTVSKVAPKKERMLVVEVFDINAGVSRGKMALNIDEADRASSQARSAIIGILTPDNYLGRLAVNVNTRGASLKIDGELVGTSPMPAPIVLKVGNHTLEVSADGYAPFTSQIEIPFEKLTSTTADLVPVRSDIHTGDDNKIGDKDEEVSAFPHPLVLGLGGVTVVSALVMAGFGIPALIFNGVAYRDGFADTGFLQPIEENAPSTKDSEFWTPIMATALVATAVTIVLVGATVVTYALVE